MRGRGMRSRQTRRTSAGVVGLTAILLLVPLQAGLAAEAPLAAADEEDPEEPVDADSTDDDIRLETSLAGYSIDAEGSPLAVLFFEPQLPVPVDPGKPHFELQTAFTRTSLGTGPQGRALASSLWPGALLGDGFATLADEFFGQNEDYPIMADARFPSGPEQDENELPTGTGMRASARGLDLDARARLGETPEDILATGSYASRSRSTVEDDVAIATTRATAKDVVLIEGLIEVDAVVTRLRAVNDGEEASTSGATNVTGLRVAGNGFNVDGSGLRPVQEDEAGDPLGEPPANATPEEIRDELGIRVSVLEHEEEVEGSSAARAAGGLHITIDTTVLRGALEEPVLGPLMGSLPREIIDSPVYPLLLLQPRIEFFIARGEVSAATSAAAEFDFDFDVAGDFGLEEDLAPPDSDAELGLPSEQADSGAALGESATPSAAESGSVDMEAPDVASPGESPPGSQSPQIALETVAMPEAPGGSLLFVLLAFAAAAVASRGLLGLPGLAFGGAGGPACEAGHRTGVPNLREL